MVINCAARIPDCKNSTAETISVERTPADQILVIIRFSLSARNASVVSAKHSVNTIKRATPGLKEGGKKELR